MTQGQGTTQTKSWVWYILVLLVCEKIVQHLLVTWAFYTNFGGIRSQVAISPDILMVLGGIVALLFILGLWGLVNQRKWVIGLLIGLSIFDILGEFIAQGLIMIAITVSFLVAVILLILTLIYRREIKKTIAKTSA